MIAHVLRLSIGEGLKIRRRWMPWILLGLIVLISQGFLWGILRRASRQRRPIRRSRSAV